MYTSKEVYFLVFLVVNTAAKIYLQFFIRDFT